MHPNPGNPGTEQPGQACAGTRGGSRRVFRQVSSLKAGSGKVALSRPAHYPLWGASATGTLKGASRTHTVRRFLMVVMEFYKC